MNQPPSRQVELDSPRPAPTRGTTRLRRRGRVALTGLLGGVCLLATGGCEVDSYFDPSVVGRWEHTPTIAPILDRIAVIEEGTTHDLEYSSIRPEDLIPEIKEHRIGAGDGLVITIVGLVEPGRETIIERRVDSRGFVDITEIGEVYLTGLTREQARRSIIDELEERQILSDPLVTVQVVQERERRFNLIGSIGAPGTYSIPVADYRLLEALSVAGQFNEDADFIYIIRQVPLTDEAAAATEPPERRRPRRDDDPTGEEPEGLLDTIDDLLGPEEDPEGRPGPDNGSPSVFPGASPSVSMARAGSPPPIGLVDDEEPETDRDRRARRLGPATETREGARWVYIDGEWVMVRRDVDGREVVDDEPELVTQRIIRVPVRPLIQGDANYNIVVRPGDVVRVPRPDRGSVFMAGEVARPGVYNLQTRLTLTRAIDAAGGLGGLAIPERVDLVRMVGDDRQATIRLNLRAIAEGTQPDIYLKDNDRINVGTSFWALPLAVFRGGFRMSYGFGFLLDRNFGNDVFGAPPVRRQF